MMPPIEAREKRCFRPIGLTGFSQSRTVFGDQRCKCAPRWPLISIHHISPFASRFSQHRRRLVPHKLKKQRKRKAYTDRKPLTHNFNRSNWNSAVQKHGAFFLVFEGKNPPHSQKRATHIPGGRGCWNKNVKECESLIKQRTIGVLIRAINLALCRLLPLSRCLVHLPPQNGGRFVCGRAERRNKNTRGACAAFSALAA